MVQNIIRRLKSKYRNYVLFSNACFLVSYPKSGNTWVRFLIGNYLTNNQCDFTNCQSIVPDIHLGTVNYKDESPKVVKSHVPFTPKYRKVIYLVRDGRDVAVSYYYYAIKHGLIDKETSFDFFLKNFNKGEIDIFGTWSNHVNGWLDCASHNFLLVKYENLKENPVDELARMVNFLGLKLDINAVQSAVKASNFDEMRKLEIQDQNSCNTLAKSNQNLYFVRSGNTGEYHKHFTVSLMQDFIENHETALKRLNYI